MTTTPLQPLVGHYRLVVSDELLAFIECAFVARAPESERAKVRDQALAEARAAELEIRADGTFISRAGAQEFYRAQLPSFVPGAGLTFEKAPGQPVTLKVLPDGSLLALQPNRPPATFRFLAPRKAV